jgi:hypothetical protein
MYRYKLTNGTPHEVAFFHSPNSTPKQPHCFTGFKFEIFGNVHKLQAINLSDRKSRIPFDVIKKFKD